MVGQVGSLQSGSVHGLLAANSATMLILGLVGGDVNDAYADTEFGGITDGNVLIGIELIGKVCDDCGIIVFTAEFLGVVFPF